MKSSDRFVVFSGCVLASLQLLALELGAPFRDHMVLQRDRSVPVWGWTDPGAKVELSFAGQTQSATADASGGWRVDLDPMKASAEGRPLTVTSQPSQTLQTLQTSQTLTLTDILVGEVWIACGQSNMECPVCGSLPRYHDRQGELTAQSCYRPRIRFVNMPGGGSRDPQTRADVRWRDFRPQNLLSTKEYGELSAIAFFYALELHDALDVPVGIIAAACGWTPINTWTPREGTLSVPSLKEVADWQFVEHWSKTNVFKSVEAWHHQPALLWNKMVAPLTPMAVRGVIWYQGCNDVKWAGTYCDKLHAFYNGWSAKFANPGLKMYVVQLAPFGPGSKFARLQMAQDRFANEEPNAGVAHINDLGMRSEIHPEDKAAVAKRLAALAFKRDYGFADIVADPPQLTSARIEGDAVRMTFAPARRLYVSNPDRSPRADFEVAGPDGVFRPAEIVNFQQTPEEIRKRGFQGQIAPGDAIVVRSPDVKAPCKVRYLMRDAWIGAIFNEANLPMGPFESDVSR